MNNVWVLSKQFGYKMSSLEFRRQAVMSILQKHGKPPLSTGPRTTFLSHGSRQYILCCFIINFIDLPKDPPYISETTQEKLILVYIPIFYYAYTAGY